jgi:NAD(P)-dependent dehydrogenase (short-subunit alcohol dehydrogenase family)
MLNARNNFIYDCLKAALNHLTRGLSMDLRGSGVRVNALLPGGTETPNLLKWLDQVTGDNEQSLQRIEDVKKLGLVATPEQIAQGVLLLCLPEASWINGSLIPIDNGFHIGK